MFSQLVGERVAAQDEVTSTDGLNASRGVGRSGTKRPGPAVTTSGSVWKRPRIKRPRISPLDLRAALIDANPAPVAMAIQTQPRVDARVIQAAQASRRRPDSPSR